ncbi:MAG TPA: transposase [Prolixibacteraceae bacterium]|nr:transposase [Prolixibacteraceae bacterium]HPR86055.1 transposase [Prolixibacteraceae bacterium]
MGQSLSKIYIHLVFHIKSNSPTIETGVQSDLYRYIGSIVKDNDSIPVLINGTADHIHILFVMSKNVSLAGITEEIKRHSSRWIKTQGNRYKNFAWQGGYAGFSVSQSLHEKTKHYIENQEAHHRKMSFKEELILFLKEYGIEYDERYLWND